MDRKAHWERAYAEKLPSQLGWHRSRLETSAEWIAKLQLPKNSAIIDIGGGVSTLVDDLMGEDYQDLTLLDISRTALEKVRSRLGHKADEIGWIQGDIAELTLPNNRFILWHDRAVFHFLVDPIRRARYLASMAKSLKSGGYVLIATFAAEAPAKCSGLPVQRYSAEELAEVMGPGFRLEKQHEELHTTPGGTPQMYNYCLFRRNG